MLFTVRALSIILLSGTLLSCSGGILGTGDGGSTDISTETPYQYRSLPEAIGLSYPLPLLDVSRSNDALEGVDESDVNQLLITQSAYRFLHDQVAELTFRNNDILRELMVVDSVWQDAQQRCGQQNPCQLPPGSLVARYTPAMAAFAWRLDKQHIERFTHLSEAQKQAEIESRKQRFSRDIGAQLDLGQVQITRLSDSEYDWSFELNTSINNNLYHIQTRWREDRQRVYVQGSMQRGPGLLFQTQYRFARHPQGDAVTLRDTLTIGTHKSDWLINARGLDQPSQNATLLKSQVSLQTEDTVYAVLSEGQVQDNGGYLISSIETMAVGAENHETRHVREVFNDRDTLSSKEQCVGLPSAQACSDQQAWTAVADATPIEQSAYFDANVSQAAWEEQFIHPEIQLQALPAEVMRYVLASPHEASLVTESEILCSGQNFPSDADLYCWGDRQALANASVYAVEAAPDGSGYRYRRLPDVRVLLAP